MKNLRDFGDIKGAPTLIKLENFLKIKITNFFTKAVPYKKPHQTLLNL